ncbi:ribosomal L18A [Tubulinosema ratisbonensis]|uniref:60S ribosomal protein L20 n=1 Tax=Tubulinosema ratisbonensis TaxID=291195 RepID=A0A437AMT7_9MICR|nr:ribosomal L18A [Tubulinosema ratisbonensis]
MTMIKASKPTIGVKEFKVFGSKMPTEKEAFPQIFTMSLFAKNELIARSKFLKQLRIKHKIKSTSAVILKVEEQIEDLTNMTVKNYGIKFVFRSRKGSLQNMYKEFRAISRCDAVDSLFGDMASRHKVKSDDVFIVSINEKQKDELIRQKTIEFAEEGVYFPVFKKELIVKDDLVLKGTKLFD